MIAANISISQDTPDQPAIREMMAQCDAYYALLYPTESNHLVSIEALLQSDVAFFVAKLDNRFYGFGSLIPSGGYTEIKRMYVDPNARGKGVGKKLLDALEEHSKASKFYTIRLETGIKQPAAMNLYRQNGYREIAPFGDYQPDPQSLFMEKQLGS